MIWGKTNNQRNAELTAYHHYIQQWHQVFAWKPLGLMNGRALWLEWAWGRAEWHDPTSHEAGYWHWFYSKELPIDAPKNNPPVNKNTVGYYNDGRYKAYCVFCQEKGSEYPVCLPCRKAVLAFRSIADAS